MELRTNGVAVNKEKEKEKEKETKMNENENQIIEIHQNENENEYCVRDKIRECLKKNQPFIICDDVKHIYLWKEGIRLEERKLKLFCDSLKNNHSIQYLDLECQ